MSMLSAKSTAAGEPMTIAATGALVVPGSIAARLATGAADGMRARVRQLLPALTWIALVVALAGPQQLEAVEALPASGRDLVLAIDLSGSMEQEDFVLDGKTVSRLDAVKAVARDFVRARAGDRGGTVELGRVRPHGTELIWSVPL